MDTFTRICKHAMQDINHQLRKYQERILLQKPFKEDAVIHPEFYKAGNYNHAKVVGGDLEKDYNNLLEVGKKLQQLIARADEADFTQAMNDFINSKS